jgi:NAD-dependent deacetylase
MFGQPLPKGAAAEARALVKGCDLLFVVRSTLIVNPANELPGFALQNGIPVVMINLFDKTKYDKHCIALIREPAAAFLGKVAELLQLGQYDSMLTSSSSGGP